MAAVRDWRRDEALNLERERIDVMPLSPFGFFASGLAYLAETDRPRETVVCILYMSMAAEARVEFIGELQKLLAPPIDLEALNEKWIRSSAAIGFAQPERLADFLRNVLAICQDHQRLTDPQNHS